MILQALTRYYESLADKGKISREGWAKIKVSFAVEFNDEGDFIDFIPLREFKDIENKGKKKTITILKEETVPEHMKRSGVNPPPYFLCDNIKYTLGFSDGTVNETSLKYNKAFINYHMKMLSEANDPIITAFLKFLERWNPYESINSEKIIRYQSEITDNLNVVFLHESGIYVHELPVIADIVANIRDSTSDEQYIGQCLVTGKESSIARIHNSIQGIHHHGASTMGCTLVGFDKDSFNSFGKERSYNAPISTYASFAYVSALNKLLSDQNYSKIIGDSSVVYWTEDTEETSQKFINSCLDDSNNTVSDKDLDIILSKLAGKQSAVFDDFPLNPDNHFYILALSPNNARVSVRFFYDTTFSDIARNFKEFYNEFSIVGAKDHLPLWMILNETARKGSDGKTDPSPQLSGDMLRAVLTGSNYPETFYQMIRLRINAERDIRPIKAASIKAFLLRNRQNNPCYQKYKEALGVKLNEETNYLPYVLGELFAVLEAIQEKASNVTTIKDRFFTSACTTPQLVFPRLIELANHHLRKMDDRNKIYWSRELGQLMSKLEESFPAQLNLDEQGIFQIGYYHKKQKRFENKTEAEIKEDTENE